MNILFICTGNTCRSPMAEALLRHKAPQMNVQSAGLFAATGAPASPQTITVLERKDIHLQHEAQQVTEELLEWADLVLTMTTQHEQLLNANFPQFSKKVFPLISYTNEAIDEVKDIADPFGGDVSLYEQTAKELTKYIALLVNKLAK